jgi:sugar lactone lactonase YvrE
VDREISVSEEFRTKGGPPAVTRPAVGTQPAGGQGWAAAAGMIVLVIALPVLGVWWLLRQNRRARKAVSATAPPAVAVQCSGCHRRLKARVDLAGRKVKCPGCGQEVLIPGPAIPPPGAFKALPATGFGTGAGNQSPTRRWLPPLLFLAALGLGVGLLALGFLGTGDGTNVQAQAANDPAPRPDVPEADIDEQVLALAFTPDGKKLVTAGARQTLPGQLMVWDVATGKELVRVRGITGTRGVAVSPDGRTVACGEFGGTVTLRDVGTGQARAQETGHDIGVNGLAFSRDGTLLVSAGLDRVLKLWDVKALQERKAFVGHTDMIFSVAFFNHGRAFVSGGQDKWARIWDVATGEETVTLRGHAAPVEMVAVSPDDKVVATGSWDRTIKFWDPATGGELATLAGHNGSVLALAFSADGKLLASATDRGTVYLWDVETRQQIRTCQQHPAPVWSLAFSPDGTLLASGSSDKTARLWDVAGGRDVATLSTAAAEATPVAPATPGPGPARRAANGWLAAWGIVVLLGALAGFGVWFLVRRGPRPAEAPAQPASTLAGRGQGVARDKPEAKPGGPTTVPDKGPAPSRSVWPWAALGLLLLALLGGGLFLLHHPKKKGLSLVNVTVGSESVAGVEESGFHVQQFGPDGQPFRWTDGNARLEIPIDRATPPRALRVQLWPYRPANAEPAAVRILVNQHELLRQTLSRDRWEQTFDLTGLPPADTAVVEIRSDTFVPAEIKDGGQDTRTLGVQVRGVTLLGPAHEANR